MTLTEFMAKMIAFKKANDLEGFEKLLRDNAHNDRFMLAVELYASVKDGLDSAQANVFDILRKVYKQNEGMQ